MVPSFSCKINNEEISFKYPCITYSFMSEVSSVPLGLLKTFIDTNFEGWSEKWIKSNENKFHHRRAGLETSTLKKNICFKDNPCVISLNSYEIKISNNSLEASFAFKISDLEFIFMHSGSDLVKNIMKFAKLEQQESKGRRVWELIINATELPKSSGEIIRESNQFISNQEFKVKFTMPWVELYKPHNEESYTHELTQRDISNIISSRFDNWEESLLSYFS